MIKKSVTDGSDTKRKNLTPDKTLQIFMTLVEKMLEYTPMKGKKNRKNMIWNEKNLEELESLTLVL